MSQINIGIIGCGKIAQVRHIPEYAANQWAHLAGFFDLSQARAQQVADGHPGAVVYDSWKNLVADPNIDAVSICTTNATHAEIALAALDAGKHVLLEKPMATSLDDCERIAEAAARSDRLLMLDHNQRFVKAHKLARDLLQAGAIGDLVSFRTTFGHGGPETWSVDPGPGTWFFDAKQTTMGAIGDLGVHKTDLLNFLTGAKVVEVVAKVCTLEKVDVAGNPIPVDDNAIAIYTLSNGAVGTMTASWSFHGPEDNSTVLYGRSGIMTIFGDPEYQVIVQRPGALPERHAVEPIQTNDNQLASGVIDAFIDAIRLGLPSPVPAEVALATMRAIFACQDSSQAGRVVAIPANRSKS